jgi:hypothetical protein
MTKKRVLFSIMMLLFGLAPLFNSLGNPRLEALHGADFARLIAVGMCFGVGLGVLFGGPKSRVE